jgi:uncharacterized protein (TIGR02588 family)
MGGRRQARSPAERLEWALGFVSGAVVLAIVGYLAWQGQTSGDDLPDLAVVEAGTPETAGPPQLRFVLSNRGASAATGAVVALALSDGEREVARTRLVVDLVPAGSEVEGGFLLPPSAEGLSPRLTVEGYLDP